MQKWMHRAVVVASGCAMVALPIAVAAQPAAASATHQTGNSQASLTFVNNEGQTITCTIFLSIDIDDKHMLDASTGTMANGSCAGTRTLAITYKDAAGKPQTVSAGASSNESSGLQISGVYTPVKGTLTNGLNDCDTSLSATCTFSTSTAPK